MIIAALALAVASPQALVGLYRSHQIEVGAALLLKTDGHFRYQLDYGAVSEAAEGDWSAKDNFVYLTATKMIGSYKQRDFVREPLEVDGDSLILRRYDIVIRFARSSDDRASEED